MRIAVPWHTLLMPVFAKNMSLPGRPQFFFLHSASRVDGDEVPVPVLKLACLVDEMVQSCRRLSVCV